VIDLVGAGDSFRAGLVAFISQHRDEFVKGALDVGDAVQMGNLMATLYITSPLSDRYGTIPSFARLLSAVRSGKAFATREELTAALR
jgi:sugar/nucleoside kinase (ribokinase family)